MICFINSRFLISTLSKKTFFALKKYWGEKKAVNAVFEVSAETVAKRLTERFISGKDLGSEDV